LHDFLAGSVACVADLDGDLERVGRSDLLGGDLEVVVLEGGVGEAVAEGEEGKDFASVVVAVADEDPLGVVDLAVCAGEVAEGGVVLQTLGKGVGELARGVGVAEEDVGDCVAPFLTGVPGFEESGDGFEPGRHSQGGAVDEDYDGVGVGGGHGGDECGLVAGKVDIEAVVVAPFVLIGEAGEDQGDVGVGGDAGGVGDRVLGGGWLPLEAEGGLVGALAELDAEGVGAVGLEVYGGGVAAGGVAGLEAVVDIGPVVDEEGVVQVEAGGAVLAGEAEFEVAVCRRAKPAGPAGGELLLGKVATGRGPAPGEVDSLLDAGEGDRAGEVRTGEVVAEETGRAVRGGEVAGGKDGKRALEAAAFGVKDLDGGVAFFAETGQRADCVKGGGGGAAAAAEAGFAGVGADYGDSLHRVFLEREEAVFVFEEDDRFGGYLAGEGAVPGRVEFAGREVGRVVAEAGFEDQAEEAERFVVDPALVEVTVFDEGEEGVAGQVFAGAGHFEVETGGGGAGGVDAAPVGDDCAFVAPLLFDNIGEQVGVLGGVLAVEEVVGGHYQPGGRLAQGDFPGAEVEFAEGALVYFGAGLGLGGLLVVGGAVLYTGADLFALDPGDVRGGQLAREVGVFGVALVVAAVERGAVEVDGGAEEDVAVFGAGLAGEGGADAVE